MMSASDSQATSSSQEEKRSHQSTCDLDDEETYVPLKKKSKSILKPIFLSPRLFLLYFEDKVQDDYEVIKKNGFFLNYECQSFIKLEPSDKHIILFDHVRF